MTEPRHFHSARKGSGSLRPFPIYPLYTQTVILSLDKPIADCFLFRPRKSCEKRRKRSHTNVSNASVTRTSRVSQTLLPPLPHFHQWVSHIKRVLAQSSTKRPTFAFAGESGYTLAFANRIAHSGSHGETRAFPPLATARSCAASEIATIRTAGGSGCTPMACVRFLRRRGPAGLRDLFRFCRNCGLYALRSGPFRVCEARGGITTLSALYVLLKRRTAACQNGSFAVF